MYQNKNYHKTQFEKDIKIKKIKVQPKNTKNLFDRNLNSIKKMKFILTFCSIR